MRVLVTGGYGLIGAACLARLAREGHELVAAGRAAASARRRFPYARWITADFTRLTRADSWTKLLTGIDAVVNCVGVLQDGAGDDMKRVHAATVALFDACARLGIRRVIHISAIGADTGRTTFARSKAAAEAHLKSLDLDWVILRPALVLAPAVYGGSAILRGIAALPLVTPVIGAGSRMQVVSSDDVAETVARALAPDAAVKVTWDLAHPEVHTLGGIVTAIRRWLGFGYRLLLPLPRLLGAPVALVANMLGWLGWRSPARSTAFRQLKEGVVGDPGAWMAATGIRPRSLEEILAARPANVQDRWHARLYWLKPFALLALAVVWIVQGMSKVAVVVGNEKYLLRSASEVYLVANTAASFAFAFGVVVKRTARLALLGMILLPILNVMLIALQRPPTWFHAVELAAGALGMALAPLLVLAVLDER